MNVNARIRCQADIYNSDASATKESANDDGTIRNLRYLPFENVMAAYREYRLEKDLSPESFDSIAGETLFRKVMRLFQAGMPGEKEIVVRLLGSKGSFPTCDICNNSNDMLKNNKDGKVNDINMFLKKFEVLIFTMILVDY